MRNLLVLVLLSLLSLQLCAQSKFSLEDTLSANRKLFTTDVIRQGVKLDNKRISLLVQSSPKWSRKHMISRVILPAGPLVTLTGIYLGYDAIKGVPMVALIDGVEYPYTVRSLPKLLGGLALFATGMSMVESANDTRSNIVKWHNAEIRSKLGIKANQSLSYNVGLQKSGVGISLNF